MKRILITAFDAFGSLRQNPSEKLLQSLSYGESDKSIIKVVLPTIYGQSGRKLIGLIKKHQPDIILLLGYSKAAKPIKLEQTARNRDSSIARDNLGNVGRAEIVPGGLDKLQVSLPLEAIVQAWHKQHVKFKLSNNAGGFVCNHVLYVTLDWLAKNRPNTLCGLVHIGGQHKDLVLDKKAISSLLILL